MLILKKEKEEGKGTVEEGEGEERKGKEKEKKKGEVSSYTLRPEFQDESCFITPLTEVLPKLKGCKSE